MFGDALQNGRFLAAELRTQALLDRLDDETRSRDVVLRDVSVVPRFDRSERLHHVDVEVVGGRIASIRPASVVGHDPVRWVVGGLVDAHVHTQLTVRQVVLHLRAGVTGVREMCGFPWMPAARDAIDAGERLGPRMLVAGHIIADHALDGYATVVAGPDHAARVVEEQARAGYDAIKVHNRLEKPTYRAVAGAAGDAGLPMVGHIPHHVTVPEAVAAGQRTFEHLKGYYNDWDLEISPADWRAATDGAEVWNCPTLMTSREGARGRRAEIRLDTAGARLLDPRVREEWARLGRSGPDRVRELILDRSRRVIEVLVEVTDRWLAGTDAGGGIAFLVPGEALLEEMELMEDARIPRDRVLHAATHALAEAHPGSGFPTAVAVGEPADLLVLDADPATDRTAHDRIQSVLLGGRSITRAQIDALSDAVSDLDRDELSSDEVVDLLTGQWPAPSNDWHRAMAIEVVAGLGGDPSTIEPPRRPIPD